MPNYCRVCCEKLGFLNSGIRFSDGLMCASCYAKTGLKTLPSDLYGSFRAAMRNGSVSVSQCQEFGKEYKRFKQKSRMLSAGFHCTGKYGRRIFLDDTNEIAKVAICPMSLYDHSDIKEQDFTYISYADFEWLETEIKSRTAVSGKSTGFAIDGVGTSKTALNFEETNQGAEIYFRISGLSIIRQMSFFGSGWADDYRESKAAIDHMISVCSPAHNAEEQFSDGKDPYDRLKKAKELLDMGALSEEEFLEEKAKILGQD